MAGNLFNFFVTFFCKYAKTPNEEGLRQLRKLPDVHSACIAQKEISCSQKYAMQ